MREETETLVRNTMPRSLQRYLYRVRWGYTKVPIWLQRCLYEVWGRKVTEAEKELRAVFIHIPKNAGSSITEAIFRKRVGHRAIRTLKIHEHKLIENLLTFTFVRNPWDRFLSAYKFFEQGGLNAADKKWATENLAVFGGFREFTLALRDRQFAKTILWQKHFRPQSFWIVDQAGNLCVDYIGRFEQLEDDFRTLCSILGIKRNLKHLNGGEHESYTTYYDGESVRIVRDIYEKDIEMFGYDFQ